MVEPMQGNLSLLGVNALSIPEARAAIEAAVRTDRPVASAAFQLSQDPPDSPKLGVVIYRAVYRGKPATEQERVASVLGAVFVTVRVEDLLRSVLAQAPGYLHFCVTDTDTSARQRQLAATSLCADAPDGLVHRRTLAFAGRQWELRVNASEVGASQSAGARHYAWLFSIVGLLTAAVLGALLLTVTGRARIIELAVQERTAALETEVRERDQVPRRRCAKASSASATSSTTCRSAWSTPTCDGDGASGESALLRADRATMHRRAVRTEAAGLLHPDDVGEDVGAVRPAGARRHRRCTVATSATSPRTAPRCGCSARCRCCATSAGAAAAHRRRGRGHHRAPAARGRRARARGGRGVEPREERVPVAHEPRAAHAAERDARLRAAARARPAPAAERHAAAPGSSQIQQAGWHLLEMINDVLDLSRIESGNLRLQTETLNLRRAAGGDACRWSQRDATAAPHPDHRSELGRRHGHGAGRRDPRQADPDQPAVSNAVKYNVDGGRIHIVQPRSRGDAVEIAVTDTGLGMTPEQLAELFQPFNRLGRERSGTEGTGIGLVISQRLAELMGGALQRAQHRRPGLVVHPARCRAAADPDTVPSDLDRLAADRSDYHRAHRALRRGQRDQCRGDARHPGAAAAGAAGRVDHRAATAWRRSARSGPT